MIVSRCVVRFPGVLFRAACALVLLSSSVWPATAGVGLTRIVVTSQDDASLSEIDAARLEVVARIAVARGPAGLARASDGTALFVSHPDGASIDVVSAATGQVRRLAVAGEPFGLAAGPSAVWVADWARDVVTRIDLASGTPTARLAVGRSPANAVIDAARHRLYVADRESADVTVVDTATAHVVARVPTGTAPFALALSPNGDRLYVANVRSGDLAVVDTLALRRLALVPVGAMPYGVAVTPDGRTVLVTNQHANRVTLIDAGALQPTGTIAVGRYPEGVIATGDGRAYVANWFSGDVSVLDLAQRREIKRIKVGDGPRYLAEILVAGATP